MTFRIVVAAEEAAIFDGDLRIADVFIAGGRATAGSITEACQLEKLAGLSDADLREQAVAALAGDYCPPHLITQRDAVRHVTGADYGTRCEFSDGSWRKVCRDWDTSTLKYHYWAE